jgi:hypothetical protein
MSWRGLAVVGVTLPDGTGSAAGSPRPATGESNGPSPSAQDLVYCPSPPPVTGWVPSFLRRVVDVRKSRVGAVHVLDLDGLLGAGRGFRRWGARQGRGRRADASPTRESRATAC